MDHWAKYGQRSKKIPLLAGDAIKGAPKGRPYTGSDFAGYALKVKESGESSFRFFSAVCFFALEAARTMASAWVA